MDDIMRNNMKHNDNEAHIVQYSVNIPKGPKLPIGTSNMR